MMDRSTWPELANHFRTALAAKFDPTVLVPSNISLKTVTKELHKGLYIGVMDNNDQEVACEGFLEEKLQNVADSVARVLDPIHESLKRSGMNKNSAQTAAFHFTVVHDVVYIKDPREWNENTDGLFFQWGQEYKGIMLPYQIRKLNVPKTEVLDRLCSLKAGVASSLWRLPEGLVFRLISDSYSG